MQCRLAWWDEISRQEEQKKTKKRAAGLEVRR
jgi:hypothetical protein